MMNVLSKSNVRYVGILSSVDVKECTIGLAQGRSFLHLSPLIKPTINTPLSVRCFGTEGRPGKYEVPGSDRVHDHIVFKAVDIQDLYVLGGAVTERVAGAGFNMSASYQATLIDDPAIVSQSPSPPPQKVSRSAPPPQPHRPGPMDQEPDFDFESANQQFQREALDCDDSNRRFHGGWL